MQVPISKQIERVVENIHALPEQIQQACIFALNRTAEWLKGKLAKEVSEEKRLKLKMIRDRIIISRARRNEARAGLLCNFRSILVRDLGGVRQDKIGVTAGGITYPHAFIATLRSGGKAGVYRRTTKKRFPVKSVTIPIFEEATKILEDLLGTEARRVFEKRFFHEIKRITGAI